MRNQTLKLYGLSKDEIETRLKSLNLDTARVKTYVKEKYQDAFLFVEEKSAGDDYFLSSLKDIVSEFAANIYADRDVSLYERLYELLTLRKKTMAIMEQATGGIITSNLMTFDKAESIIKVSYVLPSVKAMIDHFDLNPFKFTASGGVCGEIAFDIASHIRARTAADFYVVCLSTLAEGNNLYYNKDSIVSHVAIGTESGVKVFRVEFDGKRRDQMNQLAKVICFKLINILK